jgi:hypothetical protein
MEAKQVTFYPTYGYKDGTTWRIPLRVWVHTRRRLVERVLIDVATHLSHRAAPEIANFGVRIADLVADDEHAEEVVFTFDQDPDAEPYQVLGKQGGTLRTDPNGLLEGSIAVSEAKARALLTRQGSQGGWLTYHVISDGHDGDGRVQLLEPKGLSVISDIDDTIKITEIPAGKQIVAVNTFFRDFVAAPEMAGLYRGLGDVSFHYVSGGPWQLYRPLAEFLLGGAGGFPAGTFHMKSVNKNLFAVTTWEGLQDLVEDSFDVRTATLKQKIAQISELMTNLPDRQFVLIGDSGERDPEVYRQIQEEFPKQVREIRIRDVVNDRERNPERLRGMTIIPAPTIAPGVSQFGR